MDLAEQMARDNVEVPPIVIKCTEAIEKYGLSSVGIYRVSGMMSKINKLKEKLDKGTFFSAFYVYLFVRAYTAAL